MTTLLAMTIIIASHTSADENGSAKLAPIQLSPQRRQLIGVTMATVEKRDVAQQINTTGNIAPDEQLQSYVQTRFAGWIDRVFADQTYQYIRQGAPLFTVYSPDLLSTEQEYLLTLQDEQNVSGSKVPGVAQGAKSLVNAAAERLALWGVPRAEIARLARERSVNRTVTIVSPASGYIVERNALPNMYVQPDTRLYTITSFSTVWVYAAVFQDEMGRLKTGDPAQLAIDAYPGEEFLGRVDYIWPQIDIATRTARVRIAFDNRDGRLNPGMYGRVTLKVPLGRQIVIPEGGILRTGLNNVAFIDRGDGYLTPVNIELGPRVGDDFVVLRGLAPGQRIVASANFLIDSESQLQAATGAFLPPPPGVGANAASPTMSVNAQTATLDMTTMPDPPVRGHNQIRITLRDPQGKPISGADVNVTFYMAAMPAMGMTAMRAQAIAKEQSAGTYTGSITLGGGTWQLTVIAAKGGQTIATRQLSLTAIGGM